MSEPVKVAEFNLTLLEKPVTLVQKDGTKKTYILTELPGHELEAYMEENKDRMHTIVKDGKVEVLGVRSYKGMFTSLLKRALLDEDHRPVSVEEIKAFPGRVHQALYNEAQKLSALTPDTSEPAGN
jgi:hypothetical protein